MLRLRFLSGWHDIDGQRCLQRRWCQNALDSTSVSALAVNVRQEQKKWERQLKAETEWKGKNV
jgi:hypothetical protein